MDVYSQIILKIIQRQESIIGPVAIEQAQQIPGIKIDWGVKQVSLSAQGAQDEAKLVDRLVEKYQRLFGQLSVEVCKEEAAPLLDKLPSGGMPATLR